jgi:hypothetical protein
MVLTPSLAPSVRIDTPSESVSIDDLDGCPDELVAAGGA